MRRRLDDRRKLIPSLSAARSVTRAKQEGCTVFMMAAILLAIVGCMR